MLKRIVPANSSWQRTARGPLLRLRKRRHQHWPRLLLDEGYDAKQGPPPS